MHRNDLPVHREHRAGRGVPDLPQRDRGPGLAENLADSLGKGDQVAAAAPAVVRDQSRGWRLIGVDTDRYGVPNRMFGEVPEGFYGLVGRIALLAALLEDRLHVLFCVLDQAPQDRLAGESRTKLIKECRGRIDSVRDERQWREFLNRAEAALHSRHAVLHSLWPFAQAQGVRGWRNVPRGRRRELNGPVEWTDLSADQLPGLVTELVDLVRRCFQVEMWAAMPRSSSG